jgi:aquaporin Z
LLTELLGTFLFLTVIALAGPIGPLAPLAIGGALMAMVYMDGHIVLNVAATRATQGNSFYGLAIGITIVAAAFAGGPISGGAFNPAVGFGATLGSALYAGGSWSDLWLYIVGPLFGGAVGAGIYWFQTKANEAALKPPAGHPSPGAPAPVPEGPQRTS